MTERERGPYRDYSDCVDNDDGMADGDDSVYDGPDDGLTDEEAAEYKLECEILRAFSSNMIGLLGWDKYKEWCRSLC